MAKRMAMSGAQEHAQDHTMLTQELARLAQEVSDLRAERARWQIGWPPGHFYSPIPDREAIRAQEERIFTWPDMLRGIELNAAGQLELLSQLQPYYAQLPFTAEKQEHLRFSYDNPNYSYGDAIFLFSMLCHLRPQRIIEIGSGYSSCVTLDTNERILNNQLSCTFIEPYPALLRSLMRPGDEERVTIIGAGIQDVALDVFAKLEAGDILFVDSTHVSKIASDVNYIFFEILPVLQKGVYIHIHDIYFPFEYPKSWIYEGRAWNEAYLLRAFLQHNDVFSIELFNNWAQGIYRDYLAEHMPAVLQGDGSGIWLKKLFAN